MIKTVVQYMTVSASLVVSVTALATPLRLSLSTTSAQADRGSYQAAISDDGRYVVFRSNATNLVAGDTNEMSDIFVRDTVANTTERVSVESDGSEFNMGSFAPAISDDGRIVAMQSYRGIAWGGYRYAKILVHDRQTHTTTEILNVSGSNPQDRIARLEPALSGNGRFVAFHSVAVIRSAQPPSVNPPFDDNNRAHDIFVYDLQNQTTQRVSRDSAGVEGNGDSFSVSLSDDGSLAAFYSYAINLVAGDTNDHEDCFVKERTTQAISRVSVAGDGSQGNDDSYTPLLSGNGRYVAFRSRATNLVAGDTNGAWDIFVHDRQGHTIERVSVATDGGQANKDSYSPSISDDGRFVVFRSRATNLVVNDTNNRWDIFLHDRQGGQTVRVNLPAAGGEANNHSYAPQISGDGHFIVFQSDATNLVAGDTNGETDIFRVANPLLP